MIRYVAGLGIRSVACQNHLCDDPDGASMVATQSDRTGGVTTATLSPQATYHCR